MSYTDVDRAGAGIDSAGYETQPDGYKLYVQRFGPAKPKALVQLIHGMGEHSGRYRHVLEALSAAGYLCIIHDHRAMGRSAKRNGIALGAMGGIAGWAYMEKDAVNLASVLKQDYPDLPLALVAHSMGSFLAQQIMMSAHAQHYDAFILSGSNGKPSITARLGHGIIWLQRALQGRDAKATWIHKLSFAALNRRHRPIRTIHDWLSRDPQAVDAYMSDPLCGYIYTAQGWWELSQAQFGIADSRQMKSLVCDRPIWLFGGADDGLTSGGKGLRQLYDDWQALGVKDIKLTLYESARHECFNELNRNQVIDDLVAWLDSKML